MLNYTINAILSNQTYMKEILLQQRTVIIEEDFKNFLQYLQLFLSNLLKFYERHKLPCF